MAIYCMSDIHGMGEVYRKMLREIDFSAGDHLYILGDVIDRGPDGIALLTEIMAAPNITMLLGNHEYMMLRYLSEDATERDFRSWNRNGNGPTLHAFSSLPESRQQEILSFLQNLPLHLEITVENQTYYLVHGFPADTIHDMVWNRPDGPQQACPIEGARLIIGHTPIPSVLCRTQQQRQAYFENLKQTGQHVEILKAPGFWDLDCGCGHSYYGAALSCLRLDDLQEFYLIAPKS